MPHAHTKQPRYPSPCRNWEVRVGEDQCFHTGNRVAIVEPWSDGEERGEVTVAEIWPSDSLANDKQDARLIAAAPDLLAVLQRMVEAFNVDEIDPMKAFAMIEQAQHAINQAKGRERG